MIYGRFEVSFFGFRDRAFSRCAGYVGDVGCGLDETVGGVTFGVFGRAVAPGGLLGVCYISIQRFGDALGFATTGRDGVLRFLGHRFTSL